MAVIDEIADLHGHPSVEAAQLYAVGRELRAWTPKNAVHSVCLYAASAVAYELGLGLENGSVTDFGSEIRLRFVDYVSRLLSTTEGEWLPATGDLIALVAHRAATQ